MDNGTMVIPAAGAATRRLRLRVAAVVAAFVLFAMLVLVQDRADAAPTTGAAAAVVAPAAANAQINIAAIVCPTLLAIRNAFANGPFAGFVTPILNNLIVAFGCAPS